MSLIRKLRNFVVANEDGNVAVTFALAALPLLSGIGLSVEYAAATDTRARLQQVLDASLLEGIRAPTEKRVSQALASFNAQAPASDVISPSASIETTAAGGLKGVATGQARSLFRSAGFEVRVTSEISGGAPASTPVGCITLLDPTGGQSLLLNSGATVTARECEVHVHSNANPAVIYNSNVRLDVKKLCVKGRILFNSPAMRPPFEENCTPAADPLAGKIPTTPNIACTYENRTFDPPPGGTVREVEPGAWCGWNNFNGSQKIVFRPGLHIVRAGSITVNSGSEIVADGVTFFFVGDAQLRMNGNVKLRLTAPTSGTWAGLVMAEARGSYMGQFIFNGMNGQYIKGAIYLPNRELVFNSTSTAEMDEVTVVGYRAILNYTTWNISKGATVGGGTTSGSGTAARFTR